MISPPMSARRREPFDAIAREYDAVFDANSMTNVTRPIIHGSLLKYFHRGNHILELNCGTGTDAIALAQEGIHVTAFDSSSEMIAVASDKASRLPLSELLDFRILTFEQIDELPARLLDGAFSNFGGLNCAQDLSALVRSVARRLPPGAIFITCVINKYSFWEIGSFFLRGKFGESFRRLRRDGAMVRLGSEEIHTRYYTPKSFSRILSSWFDVVECYGLNIFSPGPNSREFLTRHPKITNALLKMEKHVRGMAPLNALGDHFVMVARRNAS